MADLIVFTVEQVAQIRDALNLNPRELRADSCLYQKLAEIESNDLTYNTAIAVEIQSYLTAIAELDAKIEEFYNDPQGTVKSERVDDEYSVTYQDSGVTNLAFLQRRRRDLLGKLKRDLGLPNFSGMAWRTRS